MKVVDFYQWLAACIDRVNHERGERGPMFKTAKIDSKNGSIDLLHCESGAVISLQARQVREPVI